MKDERKKQIQKEIKKKQTTNYDIRNARKNGKKKAITKERTKSRQT